MYLWIEKWRGNTFAYPADRLPNDRDNPYGRSVFWTYPITEECNSIMGFGTDTVYWEDAVKSGVLADWIDEHRSWMLAGATGPNAEAELDAFVASLRSRLCPQ